MQQVLSANSNLVFVWHDNSGQSFPDNSTQINTTLNTQGFTINVAANTIIEQPIILLTSAARVNNARHTVNVGANSQIQIIEYLMSDDKNASNNVTSIINCDVNSHVNHCIFMQSKEDQSITQKILSTINQDADSKLVSNVFSFGGGLNKIELTVALNGHGADSNISTLAYTHGTESQDILLKIDHIQPRCTSKSLARGILKDESTTNFVGKVTVFPDAAKTYADLQIKNILCSAKARANNKPELEIYNNDVHCSHGSSTGQMDEEALFYMRSRGIDLEDATAMLIEGFIQPAINSCTIPMVAELVKSIIAER